MELEHHTPSLSSQQSQPWPKVQSSQGQLEQPRAGHHSPHCPSRQSLPAEQALHPPQWLGSAAPVTHAPLQAVSPLAQAEAHWPFEQTWLEPQAMPQPPQFPGEVWGSTQAPLQEVSPGAHAQLPATHTSPTLQAWLAVPQLSGSRCRS